jgi:hypothetical protein
MLTLQKATKLNGIDDWTLTPSQKTFLLKSTERLLKQYSPEWFQENQRRLKEELKVVFREL